MFAHTDIKQAPWHVVNADNKKKARLNVMRHLLQYSLRRPDPQAAEASHLKRRSTFARRSTTRTSFPRSIDSIGGMAEASGGRTHR